MDRLVPPRRRLPFLPVRREDCRETVDRVFWYALGRASVSERGTRCREPARRQHRPPTVLPTCCGPSS